MESMINVSHTRSIILSLLDGKIQPKKAVIRLFIGKLTRLNWYIRQIGIMKTIVHSVFLFRVKRSCSRLQEPVSQDNKLCIPNPEGLEIEHPF